LTDAKKPRRPRGDGTLYKTRAGLWTGAVELPPDPDGTRRRRRVSSRDRNEALRKLKQLRADVDAGRIAVTGHTTIARWLDRWITDIHRKRDGTPVRPTTRRDYAATIATVKAHLGDKRLDRLTPQDLRDMHTKIGDTRAAEKAYVLLRRALDDAVKEQMIVRKRRRRRPQTRSRRREAHRPVRRPGAPHHHHRVPSW